MNAIDTNILIYSIDAGEPAKRRCAVELLESLSEPETVLPWQVACEVAAVLRKMARAGRFTGNYIETVAALRSCFPIALPTVGVLNRAAQIEVEAQLSTWDALLVAACAEAGVKCLFTEDIQSQTLVDGVQLINPFD